MHTILSWFNQYIKKVCSEIDEARMKSIYGDKPGEYRPRTLKEFQKDNPEADEETIKCLYGYELECWDLKKPDH